MSEYTERRQWLRWSFIYSMIRGGMFWYLLFVFVAGMMDYLTFEQTVLNMLLVTGAAPISSLLDN